MREGFRLGQNMAAEDLLFAALLDPFCGFFMAQTAENVAKDYGDHPRKSRTSTRCAATSSAPRPSRAASSARRSCRSR